MNKVYLLMLLTVAVLMSACTPQGNGQIAVENQQKLDVAQQMIQAWNDQDWDQVYALFAEDGVLHSMMKEPIVGRENIRARLDPLAAGIERIELQVSHMGVVDGLVMFERVDDFVFNGKPGRVPVVGVLDIAEGEVLAWREYYDYAMLEAALTPDEKSPAEKMAEAEAEILAITEQMQTDWNGGDMAGYLDVYWNDEDLSLLFGGQAVRGWQALSDLFTSSWTTEEAMGDFLVKDTAVRFAGPEVAIVSGAFEHQFPSEKIEGAFSHVWRRFDDGRWLIVHEHTSRALTH